MGVSKDFFAATGDYRHPKPQRLFHAIPAPPSCIRPALVLSFLVQEESLSQEPAQDTQSLPLSWPWQRTPILLP